jgi:hypothetical protein
MIQVYSDPLLGDFLYAAIHMPQDEREQIEAFVGQKYDIDAVAVGNFMAPGPKWVVRTDDTVLCVGGFKQQRPGVWRDYMLTTPLAWEKRYAFTVTRTCRRLMDAMFASKQAHRIECIAPAARLAKRPELERWYRHFGYYNEGVRYGYCANGADAIAFARVAH